jgi:hypothetical protein
MKNAIVIAGLLFALAAHSFADDASTRSRVLGHLDHLASDTMRGRLTGSAEADKAAEYIASEFQAIGLETRMQEYSGPHHRNVVGVLPSSSGKYILLGAHYDHVGTWFGTVYNGADDNASGVSALIEIGRMLAGKHLEYGLILVAFDAEEWGLYGSKAFLDKYREGQIVLMMSLDMVGHLKDEARLFYEGTATIKDGEELIRGVKVEGVSVKCSPVSGSGAMTDNFYYSRKKIPCFTVTTHLETSQYHRPTDDIATLDVDGIARVAEHVASVTEALQGRIEPTGVLLYGNAKFQAGIDLAMVSEELADPTEVNYCARTRRVGLFAMIPIGYSMYGNQYLKAECAYEPASFGKADVDATDKYRIAVPLSFVLNQSMLGVDMNMALGGYYSYTVGGTLLGSSDAYSSTYNCHEAGALVGMEFRGSKLPTPLDKAALAIELRIGLTNASADPAATFSRPWSMSVGYSLYF